MIIYKATNLINNKVYIGQTSQEFDERIKQHLRNAKNGVKTVFYNSIRKHGEDNLEWKIIEECKNEDEINDREVFWIKHYRSFIRDKICNGYNMTIGGGGLGSGENHPNYGKIHDGETRKKFGRVGENHHNFGLSISDEMKKKISDTKIGTKLSEETKRKISENHKDISGLKNPMAVSVIQLTLNGDFINRYNTIAEAVTAINGDPSCISRCCKGKVKTHKKFKWVYEKDYKRV